MNDRYLRIPGIAAPFVGWQDLLPWRFVTTEVVLFRAGTERLMASLMQVSFKLRPGRYASIDW